MKDFLKTAIAAVSVLAVGCSLQNSVSPVSPAERTASVTTPQGEIQTVKAPDGSLFIFMMGADHRVYFKKQNSATGFPSAWTVIAGPASITGNIAAYCSGAYPIYVFSVNANGNLVMSKQTVNNGAWSSWQAIGGSFQINSDIAVAGDWDGRINVFARKSSDNKLYYIVGDLNGWGTYWYNIYNQQVGPKLAVLKHMNFVPTNGLTVFFATPSGSSEPWQIHALNQFATVGWVYDAMNGGGTFTFGTAEGIVANNLNDGRMMVMGTNGNAAIIRYCYESTVGSQGWASSSWFSEGGAYPPLALAKNADGRLEVFFNDYFDNFTGHLKHKWQGFSFNPEDWSAPERVGNFPTIGYNWYNGQGNITVGTRIVADRFQNGTLAAFAQTSQYSGNPIAYTYFDPTCCWSPTPISLGNP